MADLAALLGDATALVIAAGHEVDHGDPLTTEEELAGVVLVGRALLDLVRNLTASLDEKMIEACSASPHGVVVGEGHAFHVQWSKARRGWDNDELRRAVRRRITVGLPEGDGVLAGADAAWEEITAAFNLAGGNLRTTWAKQNGIDPDEYAGEVDVAKPSLRIEGND